MTLAMTALCQSMELTSRFRNHFHMTGSGHDVGSRPNLRLPLSIMSYVCLFWVVTLSGAMDPLLQVYGQIGKFLKRVDFFLILMKMRGSKLMTDIKMAIRNSSRADPESCTFIPVKMLGTELELDRRDIE